VLNQNYTKLEILVLDDCSQEFNICAELSAQIDDDRIKCFRSERQLGVAGGRNYLMKKAKGDIFCIIDDDAYFEDSTAISRFVDILSSDKKIGIVACKVIDHRGNCTDLLVPFSRYWRRRIPDITEKAQFVSYYLGTCQGIRKKVIESCGEYAEDLMFGEEELDLSYRAISRGWRIYYEPQILVHHIPQPSVAGATSRGGEELYHHVKNRFYLAFRYLPARYFIFYLTFWLTKHLLDAIKTGRMGKYFGGVVAGIRWLSKIKREPLNAEALKYLKENFGRLSY